MRLVASCGVAVFASVLANSAPGQTFDAASVKLTGPDVQQPFTITGGPGTNDPGLFRARITMYSLLAKAFDVSTDQITGPAWLRDVAYNYTLVATMLPNTTKKQFHKMLQNLLVERFHLVFHRETRDFPGYELVVDKGGPKFKEVIPTKDANPGEASDMLLSLGAEIDEDDFNKIIYQFVALDWIEPITVMEQALPFVARLERKKGYRLTKFGVQSLGRLKAIRRGG